MAGGTSATFWTDADRLVATSVVVVDRPKGSRHPIAIDHVYPLDYGYLEGTISGDGEGVDVWLGASGNRQVTGTVCTIDLSKRDLELKLLLGCSQQEVSEIGRFFRELGLQFELVARRDF